MWRSRLLQQDRRYGTNAAGKLLSMLDRYPILADLYRL